MHNNENYLLLSVFGVSDRRYARAVSQQWSTSPVQEAVDSGQNTTRLVHGQLVHKRDVRVLEVDRQRCAHCARRFRRGNVLADDRLPSNY